MIRAIRRSERMKELKKSNGSKVNKGDFFCKTDISSCTNSSDMHEQSTTKKIEDIDESQVEKQSFFDKVSHDLLYNSDGSMHMEKYNKTALRFNSQVEQYKIEDISDGSNVLVVHNVVNKDFLKSTKNSVEKYSSSEDYRAISNKNNENNDSSNSPTDDFASYFFF